MKNVKKLWHREQMKNEAKEKKEVGCRGCHGGGTDSYHLRSSETLSTIAAIPTPPKKLLFVFPPSHCFAQMLFATHISLDWDKPMAEMG